MITIFVICARKTQKNLHSNEILIVKIIMDFKCSVGECLESITWQCDCPEKLKFCLTHSKEMSNHSRLKKCHTVNIKEKCLGILADHYKNALNHFESDCIKLTQEMIYEINNCLNDNWNYLQKKKKEINDLILSEQNDKADTIVNWVNTLNILQREKNQYYLSVRQLLGIDNANIKIVTDLEKLEDNLKILKKNFQESCEKINGLEKEFINSNENNKKLSDELEDTKKNLAQENKYRFSVEEFKKVLSNLNGSDGFKIILTRLDLQDFLPIFIEGNKVIDKALITNDNNYVFICEI
ncbi:hypothetical protein SteCoe_27515 [Stentor coeruleus]|uniref:Uncharacterized protein n=1 Tax=Stentor coeruleus TaxID=5963 RepID=A0A1R2BAN6_9CILI|nr:hypothetical protein SteCoe_27515 [Stentor coeruleus]